MKSQYAEMFPAYAGNYTKGRKAPISEIAIFPIAPRYDNAGKFGEVFQRLGHPEYTAHVHGVPHYGYDYEGTTLCFVDEEDTARANQTEAARDRSISIAVADFGYPHKWSVPANALDGLVELVADIAARNKFSYPLVESETISFHHTFLDKYIREEFLTKVNAKFLRKF